MCSRFRHGTRGEGSVPKESCEVAAAVTAALEIATSNETELATVKRALTTGPGTDASLLKTTEELKKQNDKILLELRGDNFARHVRGADSAFHSAARWASGARHGIKHCAADENDGRRLQIRGGGVYSGACAAKAAGGSGYAEAG